MPIGLLIMNWDERTGVSIIHAYPEDLTLDEKILMQIYSEHQFTAEQGLVTLSAGAINIASYYTGPDSELYMILVLTVDEEGDTYEDGLTEITHQIMLNLNSPNLKELLPTYFQRISAFPHLNNEQKLAMLYQNEVKNMVIKRLREDLVISKSEIGIWLKDQYKGGIIDLDNIVSSLVQAGIVKVISVKGIAADLLFMVEDVKLYRHPPMNLIKNSGEHRLPEKLKSSYLREVRNFFESYIPNESDNIEVIENVILNSQAYEILKLLRDTFVTRNDLEKLKKKGIDDPDEALKSLYEAKLICVIQDGNGLEHYCLQSDFVIKLKFPRYNLNIIRKFYKSRLLNPYVLLKSLELMKDEYYIALKLSKGIPVEPIQIKEKVKKQPKPTKREEDLTQKIASN